MFTHQRTHKTFLLCKMGNAVKQNDQVYKQTKSSQNFTKDANSSIY